MRWRRAAPVSCSARAPKRNLGDGLPDLPRWLDAGVPLAIGSDSQVGRDALEELRWLEYGQRLTLQRRNVAAAPGHEPSSAARLVECVRAGGAAAAGFERWGLEVDARADLAVLDDSAAGLAGVPGSHTLDAWTFATNSPAVRETWVSGRRQWRAEDRHESAEEAFHDAMQTLWR
jgi:formimidoylglutamate deiminase